MTTPTDLTGRVLQVGDFVIYTLSDTGGIEFGYIDEIKTTNAKYPRLRIKIKHSDINGVVQKNSVWDYTLQMMVPSDKEYSSWLNYTYSGRFLVTDPR